MKLPHNIRPGNRLDIGDDPQSAHALSLTRPPVLKTGAPYAIVPITKPMLEQTSSPRPAKSGQTVARRVAQVTVTIAVTVTVTACGAAKSPYRYTPDQIAQMATAPIRTGSDTPTPAPSYTPPPPSPPAPSKNYTATYPAAFENAMVSRCAEGGNLSYCQCLLRQIEASVPYSRMVADDHAIVTGDPPGWWTDAEASCTS